MTQKITFLFLLLTSSSGLIFGQMVNDFESGSTGINVAFGATASIVANPKPTSLVNTTSNCLAVGNTGVNWFSLVRINVDPDLTIGPAETKFVSMLVYKTTTDIACRFNASDDTNNGSNPGVIRATSTHSGADEWEQIVFPLEFPRDAGTFSLGTLYTILLHADIKNFANTSTGPLDNSAGLLYVDQVQILDSNPLSTESFELKKSISLYPNPAKSAFKITMLNNVEIKNISVYTLLGKEVQNLTRINKNEYDISSLSSGVYIVKIIDSNGASASKKLLKQ